ncbi:MULTISPECIES: DMT family transporter [Kitasatospora]|uniref:Drug/metabolite transporter (DMT)-like permease n=1 Tax=Kitasatospora paracochleata TaxID=58354 RepID=A0ABT1IUV5_9ACTN|nr:DMT family transporter [Kitasatospora paracochleata]MCP2308920.1 drug/metabolite transporter (DMT)-like permease [Kitasatospora paracochleata]
MSAALALTASLLWGVADYGGGSLTRRLPALTVVVVSQTAAAVLLVAAVLATGALGDASPALWYAVAAGVIGPFALLAFYRALALGPMGVVSPLATVGVVVPIGAGLALGERPGPAQVLGIAVALAGVVLAGGPQRGGGGIGRRALLLTLGAAMAFGAVLALIAHGSDGGGLLLTLCVQRVCNALVGVGMLAVAARREPLRLAEARRGLPALAAVGVADVAANGAFSAASHVGSAAVAAVLASLYPVVTALMARGLLKERLRRVQVVGAGLAVAGTLLLAAG